MKFEDWKNKPKDIKDAALDGNKKLLAAMGRKGAEIANKKRADEKEIEKIQEDLRAALRYEEMKKQREAANEHIIDSDGNDLDYIEEEN